MTASAHRLLRASAGTGKTYQLVQAYVDLVQTEKLRPAEIIAITFTRKAATELRLRVRAQLRASGASPTLLAELSRAPLGNFHGLALQLLASLGLEAGLHGPIPVLAEADAACALFVKACREAWFYGGHDTSQAVQILAPYLKVGDSLPTALWSAISMAREDGAPITADCVYAAPSIALLKATHERLMALRQHLLEGAAELSPTMLLSLTRFAQHAVPSTADIVGLHDSAPPQTVAEVYGAWSQGWKQMFACLSCLGSLRKLYSKGEKEWVNKVLPQVQGEALCAALRPALGTLLETGWRAYGHLKAEAGGLVDFADMIARFNELMQTHVSLHTAVRRRFRAVLVDEAQDTNRLQRRMVDLLCGFAGPAVATEPPARMLVVGDWKQSIYTFRGADAQSFADFADDLTQRGGEQTTLAVSRRSAAPLVQGINSLGQQLFGTDYEPLEPLTTATHDDAANAQEPAGMVWLELPEDACQAPADNVRNLETRATVNWVQERLAAGVEPGAIAILLTAWTQAPHFAAALQAVGIPAKVDGGSQFYAQPEVHDHIALMHWLVDPHAELQGAISLRSPLFGLSDSALWFLLGPQGRQHEALAKLRAGNANIEAEPPSPSPTATQDMLGEDDRSVLQEVAKHLLALTAAAQTLGAYALLRMIDVRLSARATYLGLYNGPQRVANIQRLWSIAQAHDRAHGPAVARFAATLLQRIEAKLKEALPAVASAARTAVSISTVHQAKGLQYPIVILPDLARKGSNQSHDVAYARQFGFVFRPSRPNVTLTSQAWKAATERRMAAESEEKKRLLYVAITRAERQVVFVGPPPARLRAIKGDDKRANNFGSLLKPWAMAKPSELRFTSASLDVANTENLGATSTFRPSMQLDAMPPVPPLGRAPPPGTQFRVTVTQLARDADDTMAGNPDTAAAATSTASIPSHILPLPSAASVATVPYTPLSASLQGELAHGILAALNERPQHASDVAFVGDLLARQGYAPDEPQVRDVSANVIAFLRSPLGQHLVQLPAAARRHELPFQLLLPEGPYTALLQGQLDLAYWDEAGAVIVDYKHTRHRDDNQVHLRQLDAYAWALRRLCAITGDIRCYLVYLRERTPPVLHLATLPRQTEIQARLSAYIARCAQPLVPPAFLDAQRGGC